MVVPRCSYGQWRLGDGNVTSIFEVLVVESAEKALCSSFKVSAPVIRNVSSTLTGTKKGPWMETIRAR